MALKLFSPKVSKEIHGARRDEDIAQVAYLTNELDRLQKRINAENTQWDERLREQRTLYAQEKEKLQKELRELTAEVQTKEKRLGELLLPIDGMKEQAEELLRCAEQREKEAQDKHEEVEELEERLTSKLDELTEREAVLGEKEVKLESQLKGAAEEREIVSRGHIRLNQERAMFEVIKKDRTKFMDERENAINIKEKKNQEYLRDREEDLDLQERSLQDRREALNRAFDEYHRLKASIKKK